MHIYIYTYVNPTIPVFLEQIYTPRLEDIPNFLMHHSSHEVYRFSAWQNSWNIPYAVRNLSSKLLAPNFPSFASHTTIDTARSAPKPIWKVWTKSGLILFGTHPGTTPKTLPMVLKGDGPGRSPGARQGALSSNRYHSYDKLQNQ